MIVDDRETIRVHGPHTHARPRRGGHHGILCLFFGFLLIATIRSYRQIIRTLFELVRAGLPGANITEVFVLIPAYPISRDIRVGIAAGQKILAGVLIFLLIVYTIALIFQVGHVWHEFVTRYPHVFG